MSGIIMLDIAISMTLVYFMVSLLCSTIQEAMASWQGWRGKTLYEGIEILLTGQGKKTSQIPFGLLKTLFSKKKNEETTNFSEEDVIKKLANKVLNHPLTKGQGLNERFPSYLPSRQLAQVLLRSIQELDPNNRGNRYEVRETIESLPNCQLRESLLILVDDAEDDYAQFMANLEQWYDNFMDRVSGWYKRRAQLISFLIGMTVVVALNIDSIEIFKKLWHEPALRASLVHAAQSQHSQYVNKDKNIKKDDKKEEIITTKGNIKSLGLPMGWPAPQLKKQEDPEKEDKAENYMLNALLTYFIMLIGWLITAIAASLGTPFWFSLLDKLLSIRGSGKRPESNTKTAGQPRPPVSTKKDSQIINAHEIKDNLNFEESLMDDDIVDLQMALGIKPDVTTGVIDSNTRKFIKRKQAAYGDPETGILNSKFVYRILEKTII